MYPMKRPNMEKCCISLVNKVIENKMYKLRTIAKVGLDGAGPDCRGSLAPTLYSPSI